MPDVITIVFWFLVATTIACLEIEIEGRHGWAWNLPTWYRTRGPLASIFGILTGGKPATGYHLFMFLLTMLFFHATFFTGTPWSWQAELIVGSRYFLFAAFAGFLYFVLNPRYGLKNFEREKIPWFSKSWWVFGLFPVEYLVSIVISFSCAYVAGAKGAVSAIIANLTFFGGFATLAFITNGIAPFYRDWYHRMRIRDDRSEAGFFPKATPPASS